MANINVVICDTDQEELDGYSKICRAVCEKNDLQMTLITFSNSPSFLFEMSEPAFASSVSILIVDPDRGFETAASAVRKLGYEGIILYLSHSGYINYFYQAFEARAFNFIKKGELERFYNIFEAALEAAELTQRQYISVSCAGEYRQIDVSEIHYFETTLDHMVCVWYGESSFVFPSSLSKLEEKLKDYGFLRIHRSYLISLAAVQRISYDEAVLNNGTSIPISRGNYPVLKEAMKKREQ